MARLKSGGGCIRASDSMSLMTSEKVELPDSTQSAEVLEQRRIALWSEHASDAAVEQLSVPELGLSAMLSELNVDELRNVLRTMSAISKEAELAAPAIINVLPTRSPLADSASRPGEVSEAQPPATVPRYVSAVCPCLAR